MGELILAAIVYGTIIWGIGIVCWYVGKGLHDMIRGGKDGSQ